MCVCSMEVGVCAEAYQGGEPLRHINSAFMTFEVLDQDKKPRTLPRIRPEPVVRLPAEFQLQIGTCLLSPLDSANEPWRGLTSLEVDEKMRNTW